MGVDRSVTESVAVGDLERSVVGALQKVIGGTLSEITVRALDGELGSGDELTDPDLYIGGEVRLRFGSDQNLFVSWVQNHGWPVPCSIGGQTTSLFRPGALKDWDSSDLEPWRRCLGARLLSARVLGRDETPQIVEFAFESVTLWLGTGHQREFGDGDDLLVRWDGARPDLSGWQVMWSSRTLPR